VTAAYAALAAYSHYCNRPPEGDGPLDQQAVEVMGARLAAFRSAGGRIHALRPQDCHLAERYLRGLGKLIDERVDRKGFMKRSLEAYLDGSRHEALLLATIGAGSVCGVLQFYVRGRSLRRWAYIERLWSPRVVRGTGTALLVAAACVAPRNGMVLHASGSSRLFYESCGMRFRGLSIIMPPTFAWQARARRDVHRLAGGLDVVRGVPNGPPSWVRARDGLHPLSPPAAEQ
jgi:hypothetical protein